MASYTAQQLNGAGTPTEELTGLKRFSLTNPSSGSAYFTVEQVRRSDGKYGGSPTNALGTYATFTDIDVDTLKRFSKVLEDLERLSNLGNFANGGLDIKRFATNLRDAMPDLETALYGTRQTGRKGYRGADIKGLANGGDDLSMAISNLNDLQAATGASLNEEPVQPVVNNYNFFDNSSPVQQQFINELKPKPNTNRLDGLE